MSESVIFNSPLLLMLYGLALAANLLGLSKKTGFFLPVFSACIAVVATALALLHGASLYEAVLVLLIFLLINLRAFREADK